MKKIRTLLCAILALALVFALISCGPTYKTSTEPPVSTGSASPAATGSQAPSQASDEPSDAPAGNPSDAPGGTLTMATNAAFPPYEFIDGEGFAGIDVEIAGKIAEKLGMTLEVVDIDFNSVVTSVQTGKYDMGMAGLTVTDERLENVDFTDSYATGVQVIIVKEDSDILTADDLAGKMIGVQEATTGHIYCEDDYGQDAVIPYTTGSTAVQALVSGKVDCVIIDNEPAKAFVAANPGLKILATEYITEDYAICVAKDNPELLAQINTALNELITDGTVKSIIDKYISAD